MERREGAKDTIEREKEQLMMGSLWYVLSVPTSTAKRVKAWSACAIVDQFDVTTDLNDLTQTYQDAQIVDCDNPVSKAFGHKRDGDQKAGRRRTRKHHYASQSFLPSLPLRSLLFFFFSYIQQNVLAFYIRICTISNSAILNPVSILYSLFSQLG